MLLRIGICEDIPEHQIVVLNLLNDWVKQSKHHIDTTVYADTTKLLGDIDEAWGAYDVFLLDIEMREPKEGLELARRIRTKDKHIPIIFISSHRELALESYDVRAMHFIAKPIDRTVFFDTMNYLGDLLENRSKIFFVFPAGKNRGTMPLHEIIFIEADGHYVSINGDRNMRYPMKMDSIVTEYVGMLVRNHKGYIVNISHVLGFTSSIVTLSNGIELPIGRVFLETLRECFVKYHRKRREQI